MIEAQVLINPYLHKDQVVVIEGVVMAGSKEAMAAVLAEINQYTLIDCDPPFLLKEDGAMVEFTEKQLVRYRQDKQRQAELDEQLDACVDFMLANRL